LLLEGGELMAGNRLLLLLVSTLVAVTAAVTTNIGLACASAVSSTASC
jgi:hypothetical protein